MTGIAALTRRVCRKHLSAMMGEPFGEGRIRVIMENPVGLPTESATPPRPKPRTTRQKRYWRGTYQQIHRHHRHRCKGCGHLVQNGAPVVFCRIPKKRKGVWVLHEHCEHLSSRASDGTIMTWGERFRAYAAMKP